ncbi:MAG: outer membrane beta-barrel protein [Gammaproteobacteria bacterium]|nr:outer membrane beta-barrel protein [Gammaproteobacteria bacterium]
MMLKKKIILIALTTLLLPTTVFALGRIVPYASLDFGDINGNWSVKDTGGTNTNFGMNGAIGGASIGLGTAINPKFWLAMEAFGNYSSVRTSTKNITANGGSATLRLNEKYSYGLSIIPGFILGKGMFYARFGALQTRMEAKQSSVPSGDRSPNSSLQEAGVLGLGFQASFADNWGFRAEYDRIMYRHFTVFSNRVVPMDNELRMGLMYSFY